MRSSTPTDELSLVHRFWRTWRRLARRIGDAQARVVLSVVYFLVIAPFALVVRLATDPLALDPGTPKGWRTRPTPTEHALERARRQF